LHFFFQLCSRDSVNKQRATWKHSRRARGSLDHLAFWQSSERLGRRRFAAFLVSLNVWIAWSVLNCYVWFSKVVVIDVN
jgi:hypothetical protein